MARAAGEGIFVKSAAKAEVETITTVANASETCFISHLMRTQPRRKHALSCPGHHTQRINNIGSVAHSIYPFGPADVFSR